MAEQLPAVPAVLLAAGASSRLGHPKQLVRLPQNPDETMLERALRLTLAASFDPVIVVLGANADAIEASTRLAPATVLHNPVWQQGMASSIHCGLQAATETYPKLSAVLLLVCDQPALTCEHLQSLLAAHHQHPEKIIASRYADRPGVPMLAPRSFFPELLALTGDTGARELLRAQKNCLIEIPFPGGEWDIDSPADIATR